MHIFLIHRYQIAIAHFLTPTESDNKQIDGTKELNIYKHVEKEVGDVVVATVNQEFLNKVLDDNRVELMNIIRKSTPDNNI